MKEPRLDPGQGPPTRNWKPLIPAPDRGPFEEFLSAVGAHVGQPTESEQGRRAGADPEDRVFQEPQLQKFNDDAGRALFFCYLEQAQPAMCQAGAYEPFLEAAIDAVAEHNFPPSPIGGIVQVAWTMAHIENQSLPPAEAKAKAAGQDYLQDIDAFLVGLLDRSPWPGIYDLISGLVGYGVYALERLPRPSGRRILELVVHRLAESAVRDSQGAAWFTHPRFLPEWQQEFFPEGYYNLGLAHGIPGVLFLLAAAVAEDVAADLARPLLAEGSAWFLAQKRPAAGVGCFPNQVGPATDEAPPPRLAWCYGDAGIAVSLLHAARRADLPDLEQEALAVAKAAAARDPQTAGVVDGMLCHGSCGLGHLFNRLWQATGDEDFAAAARYWFGDGLKRFAAGPELMGLVKPDDPPPARDLLAGTSGIGLCLAAALSDRLPEWDRLLLMNVSPRPEDMP